MDNRIIKGIIKLLRPEIEVGQAAAFSDKRYIPHKISAENFQEIKHVNSSKKIAFIDGGNMEIAGGPDFSLHLIRVYYTVYSNNKRIKHERKESYALTYAIARGEEIDYKADLFPKETMDIDGDDLIFSSFDSTIRQGNNRIQISKIGEIIRRFAELSVATLLAKELEEGDVIVRDGSLESSVSFENKYFDRLYKTANERKVIVAGLCKTSSLLTDGGKPLSTTIKRISPPGKWYYHPIVEIDNPDHMADMFFIRLHKDSKYVFRFEVYKDSEHDDVAINEVLSQLSLNAMDPTFIGYPYGLIEADKFARVTEFEKSRLRLLLMSQAGKDWKRILESENAIDAHSGLL